MPTILDDNYEKPANQKAWELHYMTKGVSKEKATRLARYKSTWPPIMIKP